MNATIAEKVEIRFPAKPSVAVLDGLKANVTPSREIIKTSNGLVEVWVVGKDRLYPSICMQGERMKNPAAVALGRLGGKATSEAKAVAARENAKKGGWPKGKPRKPKRVARR